MSIKLKTSRYKVVSTYSVYFLVAMATKISYNYVSVTIKDNCMRKLIESPDWSASFPGLREGGA